MHCIHDSQRLCHRDVYRDNSFKLPFPRGPIVVSYMGKIVFHPH